MDTSNAHDLALRRAIAELRAQLALLPLDDPRRNPLYRSLIWCYHEAFALMYQRIHALRATRP